MFHKTMIDHESIYLLTSDGELVHEWEFLQITRDIRLYYHAESECRSFKFCAVEWCSGAAEGELWDDANVEKILEGIAYFDGVRHMWGNEYKQRSYWNYPSISGWILLLQGIKKLEEQFCSTDQLS